MRLTNEQIYTYAVKLSKLNLDDIKLPIRISFFLQKNIEIIVNAGQEVEAAQQKVVQTFGELNEEGTHFVVPPHKIAEAQTKLDDFNGRNAEWHYLQSVVFYKKNWVNESKKQLEIAISMDGSNEKYKNS